MPAAGHEHALARALVAHLHLEGLAQQRQARAGLRRQAQGFAIVGPARRGAAQIDLVAHFQHPWPVGQAFEDVPIGRGETGAVVEQQQDAVGPFDGLPGAANAFPLHHVLALAQTGGVDDVQRQAVDVDLLAQHVAGGAGDVGDDGRLPPGQGIEQARLAGVGLAGEHDVHALAHQLALPGGGHHPREFVEQGVDALAEVFVGQKVDLLLGKVDGRFDEHAQFGQRRDRGMHPVGEHALQRLHGAARRLFGAGLDQIGDGLGLGQIDLVVEEGPLRELAGPRRAGAVTQHRLQDPIEYHRPTMALQLQHVLAGEGMGVFEEQGNALVEHLAVLVPKGQELGPAGRRHVPEHHLGDAARLRPRHTHDPYATPTGRRGDGGNGVRGRLGVQHRGAQAQGLSTKTKRALATGCEPERKSSHRLRQ